MSHKDRDPILYTIGHSTRSLDEFIEMLHGFEIKRLVDVRRFPGSKRHPHFNRDNLRQSLEESNIAYLWLEALGGRRSRHKDSTNTGLRVAGFQGYADYMQTEPFRNAAAQVFNWAAESHTTIMCAEAVYWRCHRRLVSDYAVANGFDIRHIMKPGELREHKLTPGAVLNDRGVTYPPDPQLFDLDE
jgi:uncharacterized protein (DUF488 family)